MYFFDIGSLFLKIVSLFFTMAMCLFHLTHLSCLLPEYPIFVFVTILNITFLKTENLFQRNDVEFFWLYEVSAILNSSIQR